MTYVDELILKYKSRGLLIDTNLLVLFFVGTHDPLLIPKFKRTAIFTAEDFDLLCGFICYFDHVTTTPNILTEASNLLNQLPEHVRTDCYAKFAEQIAEFEEHFLTSVGACAEASFKKFGLTDAVIINLCRGKFLVLTDDFRLSGFLQSSAVDVINFNHVRTLNESL